MDRAPSPFDSPVVRLTKLIASVAAIFAFSSVAQAQTGIYYSTTFDGTDVINGTATPTTYSSPPTAPTDPLDGQNGWTTNDATQTGTYGTSTQLVGRSDAVGSAGYFSGYTGILGGIYRTTAPTGSAPDVIPSTSTGGIINLERPFTLTPAAPQFVFNVDFAVTASSSNFPSNDTFSWTFGSSTATLFSINFAPSGTTKVDNVTTTVNGMTTSTGQAISLNSPAHLSVKVTTGASPTFLATLTGSTNSVNFGGSLATAAIAASAVTQIAATWNLADKTTTSNGGYSNAGDNALVFDNYAVTVPEPSVCAALVIGGLLLARRKRCAVL